MPTPRKSIEELMLSGTYQQNKGRYRARVEAEKAAHVAQSAKTPIAAIGRTPAHLTTDEKRVWAEIVKQSPALTQSDRLLLEVAVKLTVKLRAEGLKSAETTKLIGLLEGFKGNKPGGELIPSPIPKPESDTRTEEENRQDGLEQEMEDLDNPDSELSRFHYERQRQELEHVTAWIEERRAKGLWTDLKPKQEEKVEFVPPPRPVLEPIVEDPAKRLERMRQKWSF